MNPDFLSELKLSMGEMSKRQLAVAEYILRHSSASAHATASALAAAAGVSESTVVRFATFMGYEGYPQMQKALSRSLRGRMTTVERIEDVNGRLKDEDILGRVLRSDAGQILDAFETLDKREFERAVDMLLSARKIYIVGMRSSAVLAQFMSYYLRLLFDGVTPVCTSGGSEVIESLINLSAEDVVFAISYPRYSSGTVKAAEYAKKVGAKVAVLTDSESAPITRGADAVLTAKSEMLSLVDSLVAPMSIINAIIAYIVKKHPEISERLRLLEGVWNEYKVYLE